MDSLCLNMTVAQLKPERVAELKKMLKTMANDQISIVRFADHLITYRHLSKQLT